MTDPIQVPLAGEPESICPSCGKTDRRLWPEGCNNAWHRERGVAMSEIQRYIAKVQELPRSHKTYIADWIVVRNEAHEAALRQRDERIAALEKALRWALPFAENAPDPSRSEDDCPSPNWQQTKINARKALEAK